MKDFDHDVSVEFYLDDKRYAHRLTRYVPQIGDEVRFKGIAYKVVYRIFIYDEDVDRIAINITGLEDEQKLP